MTKYLYSILDSHIDHTPNWSKIAVILQYSKLEHGGCSYKQSVIHLEEYYKNPADQGVNPAFNRLQLDVQAPNETAETLVP
jgi:hypothetical protein